MSLEVKLVLGLVGMAIYAGILVYCLTCDDWEKK